MTSRRVKSVGQIAYLHRTSNETCFLTDMKSKNILEDHQFVAAIHKGGQAMESAMKTLFDNVDFRQQIEMFVRQNGGSSFDAQDIYQEGIRHLIMNIRSNKYNHSGSLYGYLATMCKNIWRTQFKRAVHLNKIKDALEDEQSRHAPSPERIFLWNEKSRQVQQILKHVSDACREVLGLWSLGYSFKEIGGKTNRTEGTARKQKFDCFKKLMLYLKNNPTVMAELKQLKTD